MQNKPINSGHVEMLQHDLCCVITKQQLNNIFLAIYGISGEKAYVGGENGKN